MLYSVLHRQRLGEDDFITDTRCRLDQLLLLCTRVHGGRLERANRDGDCRGHPVRYQIISSSAAEARQDDAKDNPLQGN